MNFFINEFHYDNSGADVGEFVEVAGPADADLDGFSIVLYNGSNGASYASYALSEAMSAITGNVRFITVETPGIQNGSPDAIALVGPQGVVEFLSYEGSLTATDGPAAGMTSRDIGVAEGGDTPVGYSLQRTGTGSEGAEFAWSGPAAETRGTVNAGQTIAFDDEGANDGGDQGGDAGIAPRRSASIELSGAEIVAFDSATKRFFVTSDIGLQIIDGSDPFNDDPDDGVDGLTLIAVIDPTTLIDSATGEAFDNSAFTSVAVAGGLVVAALPAADKTAEGSVLFFDAATGDYRGSVTVGALPDSLAISADGRFVVVANEGESSGASNEPDAAVNPNGSVSIIAIDASDPSASTVATHDFTHASITAEALRAMGARVNDAAPSVAADIEPEYVTLTGNRAVITLQENNAVAVIEDITNFDGFTISDIQGLGYKNHSLPGNALDPSDRDDAIDFDPANVNGIYMPDGVATYTVDGRTYTVLANEGDDREVDAARAGSLTLDADAFPNAAALQAAGALGRLTVSTVDGDVDGDGVFEALFSFGARSFSIRDEDGDLVYDSGDMLDRIAAELGIYDDGRSDNKGVEPEAIEIGIVDGRVYAFVGLERANATFAFDISDPKAATYVGAYLAEGDAAPEGLKFVAAADSGSGSNLLVVANEGSNTLTVYDLGGTAPEGPEGPGEPEEPGEPNEPAITLISAIQGTPDTQRDDGFGDASGSPLRGETVTIEAIVVGDFQNGDGDEGRNLRGFYVQEEDSDADGDARSSEGLFIFEGTGNLLTDVAIGDKVRITGTVAEFFGETQLDVSRGGVIEIVSSGNALPSAAVIELPAAGTSLSQNGDVQPDLEAYEGMRVTVEETLTITEQFQLDRFNEIKLFDTNGFEQAGPAGTTITGERPFQFTQYNAPDAAGNAAYIETVGSRTITYDDGLNTQNQPISNLQGFENYSTGTAPRMGDTVTGLSGILDYKFAGNAVSGATWRIRATEEDANSFENANERPAEMLSPSGNLKVAAFNVLNFFTTLDQFPDTGADDVGPNQNLEPRGADTSPQGAVPGTSSTAEYDRQLSKLVEAISGLDADIVSLIELENDFLAGGRSPGDQSAQGDRGIAIAALVEALNAHGDGDTYAYVDPGQEFVGGDAIAVGMIYRADKVKVADGTSPAILTDEGVDQSILDRSTVDNNGGAAGGSVFDGPSTNRSPLAVTFQELDADGGLLTVVANHFKSKGGSGEGADADAGDGAGNFNQMRLLAAEALDAWLKTNPTGSDTSNVMLVGDFNAYASEDPIDYLTGTAGFVDVAAALLNSAYSFVFDGLIGTLDYAFASMDLFDKIVDAIEWHINADEADALDYNLEFGRDPGIFDGTNPYRSSDHDPIVVGMNLSEDTPVAGGNYTLELLHFSDQEALSGAIEAAPNLSAVLNALRAQDLGADGIADNTLTLSSGDLFIPGVFANASQALYGARGLASIQIQNELGIQASALGNHDFDFGPAALAALIDGSAGGDILGADFAGTAFPYLSANLNFATQPDLAALEIDGGQAPQGGVVTSSTVIEVGGEKIGVVGATTPTLARISSTGSLEILPLEFDDTPTEDQLDALAFVIQAEVDAILEANPDMNKVILSAHMQRIGIEEALATRLSGVDIVIAGGSNTRLFDDNDRPRDGDSDQGQYPIFTQDADGNPVAIVNTDGSYKYVGRLVVEFDENGHIIADSYDADVSGAYATDAQGVADLGAEDLVDPEIRQIVDEIEAQIVATEGNVFGISDTYLNGNRSGLSTATDPDGVRTQATNLGNLTADANLAYANRAAAELGEEGPVLVSIKNGGGIRASIGEVTVPAGATEAVRLPNGEIVDSEGNVVKPEGGISENDIATALAFNNSLSLLTITRADLVNILEYGVGALPGVSGRFPQLSGIELSFDPSRPAGERIVNASIVNEAGEALFDLVVDGEIAGDPSQTFRIVTLSFLADGGDGYPFPTGEGLERVDLNDLDGDGAADGLVSGEATFAEDGTEQDALAEYLFENFSGDIDRDGDGVVDGNGKIYSEADTGPLEDERIQNLAFREDTVSLVEAGGPILGTEEDDRLLGTDGADEIDGLGGDDRLHGLAGDDVLRGGEGDDTIFADAGDDTVDAGSGDDTVFGGEGADAILGGDGSDRLFGEAGDDRIDGGTGDDLILGGEGDDILIGGAGSDEIYGGAGNDVIDVLDPSPTADYVDAGDGDDVVSAGPLDWIVGGAGEDRAIVDFSRGSDGTPVVILNDGAGSIRANDGTRIEGFESVELTLTSGGDRVSTGDVRATIMAGAGDDVIVTGSGFDMIDGGEGDDRINAGRGNDEVRAGAGNDIVYGGGGLDTLYGGEGDDILFGDGGNDRIFGDAGNDQLFGGSGNDRLFGGEGDDLLRGDGGDDIIDGGSGRDIAVYDEAAGDVRLTRAESGEITLASAESGTDTLTGVETLRLGGIDYLIGERGTSSNDILFASDAGDTLNGGSGKDILVGGAGDDRLLGGAGDDILNGEDGDDVLSGGSGNDVLNGGSGDNVLEGGSGNDRLIGGTGDDRLLGGSGDDVIELGGGNDFVDGGSGTDTVILSGNSTDYTGTSSVRGFELASETQSVEMRGVERLVFDDREVDLTDGGDAFDALFASTDGTGTSGGSDGFSFTFPGSGSFGAAFEASAQELFDFAGAGIEAAASHAMAQPQDPYDFNAA
ncbi:hypothetical protein DYI37_07615 [Fulvimarina endophytica]|uniref:Uncharacterized protein n=1 Tax=Fulvimarina endophytica TaxID=2293836 RepID=A0A371X4P5_9HYPH|nr:ExeM/NucH family extracellular endonuclease [Fulvimarina endophytica]RFC64205.1 hypothetical protein DYI37_07615 [Fulvimarina endophytica]